MGRKPKNLKGTIVNGIEIIEKRGLDSSKKMSWLCRCHCGAALSVGLKNSGALYASFKDSSKSAGKDKKGNKLYWIKKEDLCNKYVDTLENRWYT